MRSILLPRPAGRDEDAQRLSALGFEVVSDPYIEVHYLDSADALGSLKSALEAGAALVLTSSRGLTSIQSVLDCTDTSGLTAFAVGPTTAAACIEAGFGSVFSPLTQFDVDGLVELMSLHRPAAVALPRSGAATSELVARLSDLGIGVTAAVTYDTRAVSVPPESLPRLRAGEFAAVVVRSGSAARALAQFVPVWPTDTRIVASGPATARVIEECGMPVAITSQDSTSERVVAAVAAILG